MIKRKILSSILVASMLFFSLVFIPQQKAKANPLVIYPAAVLVVGGTMLIAGGFTYQNRDAIGAITTKMLSEMPSDLYQEVQTAVVAGTIRMSFNLWSWLKSWSNSFSASDGDIFNWNDATNPQTLSYSTLGGLSSLSLPIGTSAVDGKFVCPNQYSNDATVTVQTGDNLKLTVAVHPYLKTAGPPAVYKTHVIAWTTALGMSNPVFTSQDFDPGIPVPLNVSTNNRDILISISGSPAFTFTDNSSPTVMPKLTSVGSFSSASNSAYVTDFTHSSTKSYTYNGNDLLNDRSLRQNPAYDLSNKDISIPKTGAGTTATDVGDLVGVAPGQLTVADQTTVGAVPITDTGILTNILTRLVDWFDVTKPIKWDPVKRMTLAFTTTFPFSLPWDIKNSVSALTTTGSLSSMSGTFYSPAGAIPVTVEWPQFVLDFAPVVRAGFLIVFGIGLVFATRKLLGGAQ